jgi:hypothetical protein
MLCQIIRYNSIWTDNSTGNDSLDPIDIITQVIHFKLWSFVLFFSGIVYQDTTRTINSIWWKAYNNSLKKFSRTDKIPIQKFANDKMPTKKRDKNLTQNAQMYAQHAPRT